MSIRHLPKPKNMIGADGSALRILSRTKDSWIVSKDTVIRARRSPVAKRKGFSGVSLDVAPDSAVPVKIGQTEFRSLRDILIFDKEILLSVSPPELRGTSPRISATFNDRSNKLVHCLRSSVHEFGNLLSSARYADLACTLYLTALSYNILVRHSNACSAFTF